MTEFGPAPINQPCPDCGVFPLDGYMSHLTTCPQRRKPLPRMDRPRSEGMEIDGPGWLERLASWVAWHFRQINWDTFWVLVLAVIFTCLVVWFGLEWLEGVGK